MECFERRDDFTAVPFWLMTAGSSQVLFQDQAECPSSGPAIGDHESRQRHPQDAGRCQKKQRNGHEIQKSTGVAVGLPQVENPRPRFVGLGRHGPGEPAQHDDECEVREPHRLLLLAEGSPLS